MSGRKATDCGNLEKFRCRMVDKLCSTLNYRNTFENFDKLKIIGLILLK